MELPTTNVYHACWSYFIPFYHTTKAALSANCFVPAPQVIRGICLTYVPRADKHLEAVSLAVPRHDNQHS
jgi:hypothetical protein